MPSAPSWRLTLVLFTLTSAVEALIFGHLEAFTPLYLRELGVPPAQVPAWTGVLPALGFVLGLPLLPFWGVWAERYGRKPVIVRSAFVHALMFGLIAASQDVYQLAAARLLSGLALGNTGVMIALQAELTPPPRRSSAVALITAGFPLGMAVGPWLGGEVAGTWGVRRLLALDAALTALLGVVLAVVLREPPRPRRAASSSPWQAAWAALRDVVAEPRVRPVFAVYLLGALAVSTANPFVPLRVQELYAGPEPAAVIGRVLAGAGVAMALAAAAWGRVADRIGPLGPLRAALAGAAAAFALQAAAPSLVLLAGARTLQGACQAGLAALSAAALALYSPPERRASILGLSLLPAQLSWFLGPLLGGLLAQGGSAAVFYGAAALALAGAAVAARVRAPAGAEGAAAPQPADGRGEVSGVVGDATLPALRGPSGDGGSAGMAGQVP